MAKKKNSKSQNETVQKDSTFSKIIVSVEKLLFNKDGKSFELQSNQKTIINDQEIFNYFIKQQGVEDITDSCLSMYSTLKNNPDAKLLSNDSSNNLMYTKNGKTKIFNIGEQIVEEDQNLSKIFLLSKGVKDETQEFIDFVETL